MRKSTWSCTGGAFTLMTWESKHRTHPHIFMLFNLCRKDIYSICTTYWAVQILSHYFWRQHLPLVDNRQFFYWYFQPWHFEFWLIFRPFTSDGFTGPWVLTDILLVSFNFWAGYLCIPCHHNASALEIFGIFDKLFAPRRTLSSHKICYNTMRTKIC